MLLMLIFKREGQPRARLLKWGQAQCMCINHFGRLFDSYGSVISGGVANTELSQVKGCWFNSSQAC